MELKESHCTDTMTERVEKRRQKPVGIFLATSKTKPRGLPVTIPSAVGWFNYCPRALVLIIPVIIAIILQKYLIRKLA